MPDKWSYVLAAYGVGAVALVAYWRFLARKTRALAAGKRARSTR